MDSHPKRLPTQKAEATKSAGHQLDRNPTITHPQHITQMISRNTKSDKYA
jgi:hypothetical protein